MTVREYVTGKLQAFGLTEAQLTELGFSVSLDDEFTIDNAEHIGKLMCDLVAEMIFFPKQKSVSESGFSQSWDFTGLGNYYKYLCKRYDVPVNPDVLSMSGVSIIKDKTSIW